MEKHLLLISMLFSIVFTHSSKTGLIIKSKTKKALSILFFSISLITINIQAQQNSVRENFLVDKIYNYDNKLLAEYFYDSQNRLVEKIVKDQIVEQNRTIDRMWIDSFIYQNGLVSMIIDLTSYTDSRYGYGDKSYYIKNTFEYNAEGNLSKAGKMDFVYENGRVVSTYRYNVGGYYYIDTIVYDNYMNVTKHFMGSPKLDDIWEPIEGSYRVRIRNYEYDNNPKPNFGIDYLFAYNPLPYTEGAELIRGISKNNMTKAEDERYEWTYTYNEYGLPATIETKWTGIETVNPMLLRIKYRQIDGFGISGTKQEKINIYPNPSKEKIIVDCQCKGTIKLFNALGVEVISQNANGKTEIVVSNLPEGIYNVVVVCDGIIVEKHKIVKF